MTIDAAAADLHGDVPLITVDGWNVDVAPGNGTGYALAPNVDAEPAHWPATGLPMIQAGLQGKQP